MNNLMEYRSADVFQLSIQLENIGLTEAVISSSLPDKSNHRQSSTCVMMGSVIL